ncbi:MAG TPA: hypothetical protein DCS67_01600 [Clostridiales bacterium UBA8960]|nr:hypothetical protein [Clostridiales bacterium UBA8960]
MAAVLSGGKTLYYFLFTAVIVLIGMAIMVEYNERNLYIFYLTSENAIHSGDKININYKITNTSVVPIFHTIIDFKLDKKMNTEANLREIAYFGNFDRINFSKEIICKYRGYYKVGQVRVEIFDPLMLYRRVINFNKEIDITVYPQVVPIKQKLIQSQDFFGTLKASRRTIEDRTNIINIRPYIPGDQLKNIHWKLSAKRDELHTKEFEQTVSNKLFIMVNGQNEVNIDLDREELMVSFVLSLMKEVLDEDIKTKVLLNDGHSTVIEGSSKSDFQGFLETLTSFECISDLEFSSFVNNHITDQYIDESRVQNSIILVMQTIDQSFLDGINTRGQTINIFTFTPKTADAREFVLRNESKVLRFHYIDQIMDVTYGK